MMQQHAKSHDFQQQDELTMTVDAFAEELPVRSVDILQELLEENDMLRQEIRVARKAAELTANLVVKQFEETEKILRRFQVANAQRKAVLDSATQISIIATNTQGVIVVFNRGAENLLGYSAGEIIGKKTPEIFHLPSELAARGKELGARLGRPIQGLAFFFAYAALERSERLEWTYVRRDGTTFPVRMSINPLREPDGTAGGFLCIAMDITEKKRSEKALQESERNYRLLLNNLPNIVYKGYLDGSIDFFDDKIEKLTGYRREDFLSRRLTWFDLVYEEDLEAAKEKFKQALKSDKSYIREYRFKSKHGDVIWVEEGGQIIYGEDGEIEFITGAFLDISERKLAEKALHESEQKYRSLFNSGPNPIFVLDRHNLEILDANPSAEETYGYDQEALIGRPFTDLGPFEYEPVHLGSPDSVDRPTMCVVSQKVQHFKKGGQPFFVRVTACPTRYREREAIILAVTDITEMVEKDAQLIQASKMTTLGEMSAGIAHELNQPLNAIKMGNEYLKMIIETGRQVPAQELMEVVTEVSGQVDRASEIINLLREFGRKPGFGREAVDVNRSIKRVLGIIGRQLRLGNMEVRLELSPQLPPVMAQNNRLEQVFFNLITNARDAIEQRQATGDDGQGVITIRSREDAGRVVVSVADSGTGIAPEVRDKIFEPFFTTKEVSRGMGLGLSIVYGIVRDYDGRIDVTSELGEGTTIEISFPAVS